VGRDIEDNGGKASEPVSEPLILEAQEDYVIFGPPPDVQSITPGARLKSSKPKSPPMRPRT